MGTQFLIDSSAVIKFLNRTLPPNGAAFVSGLTATNTAISFVSEIELQAWNPANPSDLNPYKIFVAQANIIGITSDIIAETITIRRSYKLKFADAIIAATAITDNRTLVGDNDKDFLKVPNLKYINPRTL